ncbi:MAG TPA: aryl-sulfate sulfotransferase [Gemmataceae bacterium]|nr:aryl-sulfate sulfotransferase [Gemmataceae bacterium]
MALTLALWALGVAPSHAQPAKDKDGPPKDKQPAVKLGLSINDPRALQGYTVLAPLKSSKTYLIDMKGRVVRTWDGAGNPASFPYLLENGHLLRPADLGGETKSFGGGPAPGGRIQEFTWDGEIVWDFKFFNEKQLPHHDITRMPNGNVLMIVWDRKTPAQAIAAGRRPAAVGTHLLPDSIIEIKPTGKTTGDVVWEWHLWDHLVQDFDKDKPNYGKIAEHPELVDINFGQDVVGQFAAKKDGLDKLKGIGYVGNAPPKGKGGANADWTHANGVAYNADFDQISISIHNFSEFWIIDHSTSTAEAAGHTGGRGGKGGDLLYRWGNPRAYAAGTKKDQTLFAQHNAHWIPKGMPGEGHIMVFNNGGNRPDGTYSSVDELVLPVDAKGHYTLKTGAAYGPEKAIWSYSSPKKDDPNYFYSSFISGVQRLANGNTLICSGANGTVFEVTPDKEIVWKYINPVKEGPGGPGGKGPGGKGKDGKGKDGKGPGGFGGPGGALQPGQILPTLLQDVLKLTADQRKQVDEIQKHVTDKLDKVLTEAQNKQFKEAKPGFGPGGFGAPPQPGQIMSPFLQAALKLADNQKKQVEDLQKDTDAKLDTLLADEQKTRLKDMRAGGFGPGGPGGGFGGPGGPGGGGPPGGAALFRANRFAANYPGLAGRDLTPGKTVEELQPKEPKAK